MVPDRKGAAHDRCTCFPSGFSPPSAPASARRPGWRGAPWLDGLVMEHLPSGNVLRITFPHIYFARWFAPHETDFSAAVNAAWPDDVAPRLEYILHGQPLPGARRRRRPLFRIPDILFLHAGGSGDDAPLPGGARNAFPLALARAVVLREPGHSPFLLHGEKRHGQEPSAAPYGRCPSPGRACGSSWPRRPVFSALSAGGTDGAPVLATGRCPVPGRYPGPGRAALCPAPAGSPAGAPPRRGPGGPGPGGRPPCAWNVGAGPAASVRRLLSAELTPPDMEARMRYLQQCCRENALTCPANTCASWHAARPISGAAFPAAPGQGRLGRGRRRTPQPDDLERLARTGPVQACHAGHERSWPRPRAAVTPPPPTSRARGATHAWSWRGRRPCTSVAVIWASYPELGRAFGGRDHSTVIHAVKKIGKMLESNKDVQRLVARLEKCAHQEQPDSPSGDGLFRT